MANKLFKVTRTYTVVMSTVVDAETRQEAIEKVSSGDLLETHDLHEVRNGAEEYGWSDEIVEIPTCPECGSSNLNKHGECMEKWYCPNFGGEMPMSMRIRDDGSQAPVYDIDDDQQLDSDPHDVDVDDGGWERMNEPSKSNGPEYPDFEDNNDWGKAEW